MSRRSRSAIEERLVRSAGTLAALLLWSTLGIAGSSLAQSASAAPDQPTQTAEQIADRDKAVREQVFQDLAGLARYRAANAALPLPGRGDRRVVFMGDSITDFWVTIDPQFFARRDYIDRGISGQTTMQMLLRFRQDVIALKPDVVHIMAGTNDVAGNTGPMDLPGIEANIESMVDLARANGIRVVIASVLPAAEFSWRPGIEPGPKIAALNRWLKDYAKAGHLIYADYYLALTDGALGMKAEFTADGVHPTLAGYLVMDPLAHAAIRKAQQR
jgi:lysophospholipase L1-like esterase